MSRDTLYINLYGSPGTGKTTTMAGVFHALKNKGVNCEMVSEFAKDLVWEERHKTFQNEIYIFAKQHQRLFRLDGKVDIVVTDRPLLLTCVYNDLYGDNQFMMLNDLVMEQHVNFRNVNIFLKRTKDYSPIGRNQSEEESDMIAQHIQTMLSSSVDYYELDADLDVVDRILKIIEDEVFYLNYLNNMDKYDDFIDGTISLARLRSNGVINGWYVNVDSYNEGDIVKYCDSHASPQLLLRAALSQVYVEKLMPVCKNCGETIKRGTPAYNMNVLSKDLKKQGLTEQQTREYEVVGYCESCHTSREICSFGDLI